MERVIDDYISRELVHDSILLPSANVTRQLEMGVLNSLILLRLMTFVQGGFSTAVDDDDLVRRHFVEVDAICSLLCSAEERSGQAGGHR